MEAKVKGKNVLMKWNRIEKKKKGESKCFCETTQPNPPPQLIILDLKFKTVSLSNINLTDRIYLVVLFWLFLIYI